MPFCDSRQLLQLQLTRVSSFHSNHDSKVDFLNPLGQYGLLLHEILYSITSPFLQKRHTPFARSPYKMIQGLREHHVT